MKSDANAAKSPAKYLVVKQIILEGIAAGRYSDTLPVPSEKVLAQKLRVAPVTVSRALQELVEEGLLTRQRGRGRGTFVNTEANRVTRRSDPLIRRIGVLHAQQGERMTSSPVFYLTFLELQRECVRRGIGMELLPVDPQDKNADPVAAAVRAECQALVVLEWPQANFLPPAGGACAMPVVVAGPFRAATTLSYVAPDDFQGACAMTEHLLQLGHKNVMMISGREFSRPMLDRESGWRYALTKAEIQNPECHQVGLTLTGEELPFREFQARVEAVFRAHPPPSAVFARDSFVAGACIEALTRLGLRCPEDVSVACIGRFFEDSLHLPRLTAAQCPDGMVGKRVLDLVSDTIAGRCPSPTGIHLPMAIVEGATTRALAGGTSRGAQP